MSILVLYVRQQSYLFIIIFNAIYLCVHGVSTTGKDTTRSFLSKHIKTAAKKNIKVTAINTSTWYGIATHKGFLGKTKPVQQTCSQIMYFQQFGRPLPSKWLKSGEKYFWLFIRGVWPTNQEYTLYCIAYLHI